MSNWIEYLVQNATSPGPISNDLVFHKVDNEYDTYLGKDLYLISEKGRNRGQHATYAPTVELKKQRYKYDLRAF